MWSKQNLPTWEVLVRHLSFTHVISPGKRHSPVDHGASEHLGQCSSPQGLGNGPVGESNFTGVLWQKWMSLVSIWDQTLPDNPAMSKSNWGFQPQWWMLQPWMKTLTGESFWAPCRIRWRHVRTMNQERPWPHPTDTTPYKAPQRHDQLAKKKKQPLKEQLTLWLVPPQNLAIESCCFQLGRRTTTAKLVPQIGQTPWHTTKHGSLLIGRWIWELRRA